MAEPTLQEILIADLMGNSSKSPRENAAVAEITALRAQIAELKKHGKAEKGSTAKVAGKAELVTPE
jgi:hypothetical protein